MYEIKKNDKTVAIKNKKKIIKKGEMRDIAKITKFVKATYL